MISNDSACRYILRCSLHYEYWETHLELDLGLGNVLLAAVSASNLLRLCDLVPDSLGIRQSHVALPDSDVVYLCAEVLECVSLNGVDAELRVGLDGREAARQEVLLAAAALLEDLNEASLQLLDGRNVVGQDTHLAGFRGKVDLDAASEPSVLARTGGGLGRASGDVHVLRLVDRLWHDTVSIGGSCAGGSWADDASMGVVAALRTW